MKKIEIIAKYNKIRQTIKAGQALYRYSNTDMAVMLHMSTRSWERRLTNPSKFTLDELVKIDNILHTGLLSV